MSSTHQHLLRAILVFLFFISPAINDVHISEAIVIRPQTVVQIQNTLESKANLQIHCKDKNFDLGFHQVPYFQTYEFGLMASKYGVTQYFCGFVWSGKLHWFDIYLELRDTVLCGTECRWFVKVSRACLQLRGTPNGVRCFPWNKN